MDFAAVCLGVAPAGQAPRCPGLSTGPGQLSGLRIDALPTCLAFTGGQFGNQKAENELISGSKVSKGPAALEPKIPSNKSEKL